MLVAGSYSSHELQVKPCDMIVPLAELRLWQILMAAEKDLPS